MITSLVALILLSMQLRSGGDATLAPSFYACEGMVVTAHPLATAAALQVLQEGGNAFDAAVTAEFALAVVLPIAGNIGGGGFALLHTEEGELLSLDYREQAPASLDAQLYVDKNGQPIDKKSTEGAMAAGIPGTVAGMHALHQRLGKLPWQRLVQPAIELAQAGWPLTLKEAEKLNENRESLNRLNNSNCYLCGSQAAQPGHRLQNQALAQTLERIRDLGRDGFYEGETAQKLATFMEKNGGLITESDLSAYQAIWREPIGSRYKHFDVFSMGPPSSGGVLLHQMLGMLSHFPLEKYELQTAEWVHLVTEAARRAYADRAEYLGDPSSMTVAVQTLLDSAYLAQRASSMQLRKASKSSTIRPGDGLRLESDETTHYIIVDSKRNIVSATTSLNGAYGSKVVAGDLGFLLNNTIDDFSLAPGIPNSYGLVGSHANAPAPGKRMLSSMTPTIVLQDGLPVLVAGTPGGSTIPTTVLQILLMSMLYDLPAQSAVAHPRFHHQWLPDYIQYEENRLTKKMRRQLRRRGHELKVRKPYGRAEMVRILPDGTLEGGADPRGDDTVLGY